MRNNDLDACHNVTEAHRAFFALSHFLFFQMKECFIWSLCKPPQANVQRIQEWVTFLNQGQAVKGI
jgi:hypothetical protein